MDVNVGINSQTPQTPEAFNEEVVTSVEGGQVTNINEDGMKAEQPGRGITSKVVVFKRKWPSPTTKDKNGYDLGASCSNQRGDGNKRGGYKGSTRRRPHPHKDGK